VPIENSAQGSVVETLDAFLQHGRDVAVYAEIVAAVSWSLLADCEPRDVKVIWATPEARAQCRSWIATQYPRAELRTAATATDAVEQARREAERAPGSGAAAVAVPLTGRLHGLDVLFEGIEDDPGNLTRLFVLARAQAQATGDDKTSVVVTVADEPGALMRVLSAFAAEGLDLAHIDKRPARRHNPFYAFFIDVRGHRDAPEVRRALAAAADAAQTLQVLGSYPRAARIL
jgi:chorismate mutase/prephenate dehydratase